MSMKSKSVIYDGEVYWDCLENFLNDESRPKPISQRARKASSSGYSGSESEDVPNDWQEQAFEELGETPEV